MAPPKLGVFKFTCCAGCEFELIYFQPKVLETLGAVEVRYFKMLDSGGVEEGPFDVALIDGGISESWQADQLKQIRANSRYLVPIGSCAVNGGIPAIKNTSCEMEVEKRVYEDLSRIHSMKMAPIDHIVKVDAYIRGCPMSDAELLEVLSALLLGKQPVLLDYCVCVECKLAGNICVLVADNKPCMGPVTNAGCGALCPSRRRACFACWGPVRAGANPVALARQFESMGYPPDEIVRRFTEFGSPTLTFRKGAELYE